MTGTTKAKLLEEVTQLRRRISRLEQQHVDSAHVTNSIINATAAENSCVPSWLTQIYRDAPVGLCYFDTQLRYININEWLANLNGRTVEEHIGRSLYDLYPELAAKAESQLLHVIETGEPVIEVTVCTATPAEPNVQRYFQFNFVAVKSADGNVVGINCAVTETTEQMRAEAMLQKSQDEMELRVEQRTLELQAANSQLVSEIKERKSAEQKLKTDQRKLQFSLNATGTSTWEINLKTGEVSSQKPTVTWLGYEPDEAPSTREAWKSLIHPDDVDIPKKKFLDHLEGRAPLYECEYRVRGKNGEWYWTLDRGIIIERAPDGTPLLVAGTDTDITKQKNATEALRKNQQFLKTITDSETQLVWVYNVIEQRNVYATPSLAKFYGLPLQEMSTCPKSFFHGQVHPDDLEIYISHTQKIREASDEDILVRELRVKNHTGEFRWISAQDVVLDRNADGLPLHILGTAVDFTEHKRAELLLEGEKKFLEVVSSSNSPDGGLTELVDFIETQSGGMICSILLLDDDGLHLRHGASTNLPDDYNRAINGMEIGPNQGSCGTAAFLNQTVVVSDIACDPLWVNFRDLAMKQGFRACWSIPIRSSTGSVLGTFAMYYSEPRSPDAFHKMLTERAVHLAAIAIERKKAEDKLTQSEQKLRRAQQIAHVGSFEVKPNGSPLNWSDECYRILGLEPESKLPSLKHFLDNIVHPDDRNIVNRTVQNLLKKHSPFNYVYRILRPDGSIRWVHSRGEPILDDTGTIAFIQGTLMDITDRKLTLDRLDEFNIALSNAMPGISRLDTTGCYVEVNDDYATALGYEPHELIGGPWNPTVHPDDMIEVVQAYENMCRDGKSEFEARAVRKDGSLFYKQVLMVRIDNTAGTMTGHHCFMRDISERKSAEAALRESNDRFRTIFESVPECVKLLDVDGNLLDMNAAGLTMIEADSIDEVRGESVYNLIATEYTDAYLTNVQEVFEGGSNTQEFELIGLRGTRRWMETHQVPLRNSKGKTTTLLAVTHDVTKRKRVEEARRASERWFRSIFEQAGVAVGVLETQSGKIVRVNSKYAKLVGYSSTELTGKTWMEVTHPEDISQDQVKMDELIEGQIRDFSIEKRLIHKSGSVIWINLTVSSMWQPDEKPDHHIVIIEDITARKLAEDALKDSENRLRLVADSIPAFISYVGVDRCYGFVNKLYESTVGLGREQILGKPVWEIIGNDNYELIRPHIDSALSGNSVKYETVIQLDRRRKYAVSVEHVPDRGPDGTIRGYYTLTIDITERKKAEDELNTIFDMSLDLICVADIDTATFVKVNPALLRLLGYSENELLGRTFLEFIHPDDVLSTIKVLEQNLELGKKVHRFENRYRTKAGEYRLLSWSSNPNLDSGLAYSIARDITELRNEEEQAWKHRNELAHMARISTMGEMATGIAHELNQPLTAIASYSFTVSNIINQVNLSPTEVQDILDKLEDQVIRAGDIVRRLRNFAKKADSEQVPIDLNMLVRDVVKFIEPDSRQSETKLAFHFFEPSPTVFIDEIQIQQVLVNLIRNAIDAMQEMPTSQRKVTISTQILDDGQAEVSVCDAGTGLTKEEYEQAFNAFFSTKQEGMGMGLPISRSIVEAHGGKLMAEMNKGAGMTFKFTIPLKDGNEH